MTPLSTKKQAREWGIKFTHIPLFTVDARLVISDRPVVERAI
jgi:hypothetical protein